MARPPSVISRCRLDCLHESHRRKRPAVFFPFHVHFFPSAPSFTPFSPWPRRRRGRSLCEADVEEGPRCVANTSASLKAAPPTIRDSVPPRIANGHQEIPRESVFSSVIERRERKRENLPAPFAKESASLFFSWLVKISLLI